MDLGNYIKNLKEKVECMPECESKYEFKQLLVWLEELQMFRKEKELGLKEW